MTDQKPYTPDVDEVRAVYVCRFLTDQDTAPAEFDRFIAQVEHDAARAALDGLLERCRSEGYASLSHLVILNYRDTHYPEDVTP